MKSNKRTSLNSDARPSVGAFALALLIALGACAPADQTPIAAAPPTPAATATPSPAATPVAATPTPVPTPTAVPLSDAAPTRVVVAGMKIDLPVTEPAAEGVYPLCDVAAYLAYYSVPGMPGLTYLYAHAQKGMFLPLLTASLKSNGDAMLAREVKVYTDDDLVRTYEITEVHRRVTNLDVADGILGDALILQTSETSRHTGTKLSVVARPIGPAKTVATKDAHPAAKPRVCGA